MSEGCLCFYWVVNYYFRNTEHPAFSRRCIIYEALNLYVLIDKIYRKWNRRVTFTDARDKSKLLHNVLQENG